MKKFLHALVLILFTLPVSAQVTGLSGWNIFVDPGHSQNENVGQYGYSEAHKVLRVGLNLREILLNETDIDTVYMSRTNDQVSVGLTERCNMANDLAAAWYHSIHSDASTNTSVNSTLLLWGQNQNGTEKTPNGGKAMSGWMTDILTRGYRTNTRGSWGDCSFYGTCSPGSGPYLAVNRLTSMPSELSEAGFHTSLIQNMINMNALWKRLEARTFYWSILKFKNIARPPVRIIAGHVKDADAGTFMNGAIVSVNGQTDTTDTYESLFHLYSTDPERLRNGFFYFENILPGTHTLTVTLPGYDPFSTQVTVSDTFFTFVDPLLISSIPPVIMSTIPEQQDSVYPGYDNISITFSRPMDRTSVENNLVLSPSANLTFNWTNGDKTLIVYTSGFTHGSQYSLTVSGNSKDKYNHLFDGDGNGIGGDSYMLNFRTKIVDVLPPLVGQKYPAAGNTSVSPNPVVNLTFNELVNTTTLSNKFSMVKTSDQASVSGQLKYYPVGGRGVLNFFVKQKLLPFTSYTVKLAAGIKDVFGNEMTVPFEYNFTTGDTAVGTLFTVDNFETGISKWLQPSSSTNTTGIIVNETALSLATNIYSSLYTGTQSMKLTYAWDTTASGWLIRNSFIGPNEPFLGNSTLKVLLFGDGKNNKFRFCINDAGPGGHEVSPWYDINWFGWNEVAWTPSIDGLGQWIGDGVLQGSLSLDSYQFTYNQGGRNRGEYYFDDIRLFKDSFIEVEDEQTFEPIRYTLEQNYPNPFNPTTKIRFGLFRSGSVKLEVYNLIGQKVATLLNTYMDEGYHSVSFDASALPSGVYIYKLESGEFISSKKLVLMK